MERLNPNSRRDPFGSKINRDHSAMLAYAVPWVSILLGSLTPLLPVISPAPILPPVGFIMLLAWRLLRPGLLPLWVGLPLGAFDDLFSGQPFGFGILLFTLMLLATEAIQIRFPWPNFLHDWLTAALILAVYLIAGAILAGIGPADIHLRIIMPQLVLSIVLFPLAAHLVAALDRLRLLRVRRLS